MREIGIVSESSLSYARGRGPAIPCRPASTRRTPRRDRRRRDPAVCRRGADRHHPRDRRGRRHRRGHDLPGLRGQGPLLVAVVADVLDPAPTAAELRGHRPARRPSSRDRARRSRPCAGGSRASGRSSACCGCSSSGHERGHEHGRHLTPISRPDLTGHPGRPRRPATRAPATSCAGRPQKAARLLHLVTVASTHPILTDDQPFDHRRDRRPAAARRGGATNPQQPDDAHNCRRARDRRRRSPAHCRTETADVDPPAAHLPARPTAGR